jgi:hypothetical protein
MSRRCVNAGQRTGVLVGCVAELRGDEDLGVGGQHRAEQAFAVAGAVDVGGVKQRDARFDGAVQGPARRWRR